MYNIIAGLVFKCIKKNCDQIDFLLNLESITVYFEKAKNVCDDT